jgi:hypothetical protein
MSDREVTRTLLRKSKWTPQEDEQLRASVATCGTESWNRVAASIPTRTGKQCRERWIGQIAPTITKDGWLPEEDAVLIRAHSISGNRWTSITAQLPGRSPLSVKNRWHWLKRHGTVRDSHSRRPRRAPDRRDVLESVKHCACRAVFEPLWMDDGWFRQGFQEFRAQMLTGNTPAE